MVSHKARMPGFSLTKKDSTLLKFVLRPRTLEKQIVNEEVVICLFAVRFLAPPPLLWGARDWGPLFLRERAMKICDMKNQQLHSKQETFEMN